MIEYLILLFLSKYRHVAVPRAARPDDDMDWHLEPGAGIGYEPPPQKPKRKRPDLRIV